MSGKAAEKHGRSGKGAELPAEITIDDLRRTSLSEKAGEKLLEIVLTALHMFHTRGYGHTTTREIGRACHITAGGHLYYYIQSKDDFHRIFIEIAERDTDEWIRSTLQNMETMPADRLLEKCIREYAYSIHMRRKILAFWYHAAVQINRPDALRSRQIEVNVENLLEKIIERGNSTGYFHVGDPYLLAINIVMMCHTWSLKRWLIRDKRTIDQYVDRIVEFVMAIVRGSPEHGSKPDVKEKAEKRK